MFLFTEESVEDDGGVGDVALVDDLADGVDEEVAGRLDVDEVLGLRVVHVTPFPDGRKLKFVMQI